MKGRKPPRRVQVRAYLNQWLIDELRKEVEEGRLGTSISEVIREILRRHFERKEGWG